MELWREPGFPHKGWKWEEIIDLQKDEQRKIDCGKAHFEGALGVNYRVVKGAADLP